MTNSEAIKQLKERYDIGQKEYLNFAPQYIESLKLAMESLEENAKLKAEIEQLKEELEQWQSTNLKLVCELTRIECENNQLKSELEQSVKLPCKCENCKYADFMGAGAERFFCMEHHRYMVVGGYCSFGKREVSE